MNKGYTEITGNWSTDVKNINTAIDKANCIVVGEDHEDEYIRKFIKEIVTRLKPNYFLTEHVGWLELLSETKIELALSRVNNASMPFNKYSEYWLTYFLERDVSIIGIDYKPPSNLMRDYIKVVCDMPMPESFNLREARMVEVLDKYATKSKYERVLMHVGDTHLRTTKCDALGDASPIMDYVKGNSNIAVFRLADKYQEIN